MANGRTTGPNLHIARFVFDNMWSVDRLEAYATSYYPDGIPLRTLRHGLGHNRVPLHQYAQTLVKFATLLLAVGHVRTPASLLVEVILFRTITPLTQVEVGVIPEKEGGGGTHMVVITSSCSFVPLPIIDSSNPVSSLFQHVSCFE
jgi:hypothetical protein